MKKFLLSLLVFFVLLLTAAVFLPYLFKDRIIATIKEEANKSINANLDFNNSIKINIFKSFPNLYIGINNIVLNSTDSIFSNDTIIYCDKAELKIDLMKLYRSREYVIKSLSLNEAVYHMEIAANGKANWDITKETDEESSVYALEFDKIVLDNNRFFYRDFESNIFLSAREINHVSKGIYSSDSMRLSSESSATGLFMSYDGVPYLSGHDITQSGKMLIDWTTERYSLPSNSFQLNGLPVEFDGMLRFIGEAIDYDLKATSSSSDLRHFLSLIPAIYSTSFENIESKGKGSLAFTFKGLYDDKHFPAYGLNVLVEDGWFKYPDFSMPAEELYLDLALGSKTGEDNDIELAVKKLHFKLGEEPFDAKLFLKEPFSDPLIDAEARGLINLDNLSKIMPLPEGTTARGKLLADMVVRGRVSAISSAAISRFEAKGDISTTGLEFNTADMPLPLQIDQAQLIADNQSVSIPSFSGKLGKNDIGFTAKFSNFFAYLISGDVLGGTLNLKSRYFNANDFLAESSETNDSVSMTLIEVPGDLNMELQASIDHLIYDDLDIYNFSTSAQIVNQSVILDEMSADLLGGKLAMNGAYVYDLLRPRAKFNISYSDISADKLSKHFKVIRAFAPFAKSLQVNTKAILTFESDLKEDMSPKLSNINLGGSLSIDNLELKQFNTLKAIDKKLGMDRLSNKSVEDLLIGFKIKDGQMLVSPFEFLMDSIRLNLEGVSKLDGSIDYDGLLSLPASYISTNTSTLNQLTKGSIINNYVPKPGDYLKLALAIGGTYVKPELRINLKEVTENYRDNLKKALKSEISDQIKQAEEKAKEEIDQLKQEAERKAAERQKEIEAELERQKRETEERLKKEAEEKKRRLKEEADKKLKDLIKPK